MSSRKEEKARLRQEREERERTAAAGAQRRRLIGYGVAGVLGAAALVAIIVVALAGGGGGGEGGGPGGGPAVATDGDFPTSPVPPQRTSDIAQATRASRCTAKSFANEGRDHVPGTVKYKSNPPHSGDHNPIPAEDGPYLEAPRNENLVHSLEHGRIVIQFKPSVSEEVKGQLKSLFDEDPYHILLVPNPRMPYEVAATAWTEVLGCPQANEQVFDAIRTFKERHRDRGPEFVP
jgi:hypothetical protein